MSQNTTRLKTTKLYYSTQIRERSRKNIYNFWRLVIPRVYISGCCPGWLTSLSVEDFSSLTNLLFITIMNRIRVESLRWAVLQHFDLRDWREGGSNWHVANNQRVRLEHSSWSSSFGCLLEAGPWLPSLLSYFPHWSVLSLLLQRSIVLPIRQIVEQLYSFPSSCWSSLHSSFKNFL